MKDFLAIFILTAALVLSLGILITILIQCGPAAIIPIGAGIFVAGIAWATNHLNKS